MKRDNAKMSYESEADVLRIETSRKAIDSATEMGNVIVHLTKEGTPVYFEILNASQFLKNALALLPTGKKQIAGRPF